MTLFDTGVRPAVDSWLLRESTKKRSYGDYWSASSAGYCQRRVIFERLGVPHVEKEDDARKQRVFTAGHLFHDWIQRITKEAGLSIAQELELQDEELMIRGHIDDLVLVGAPIYEEPTDSLAVVPAKDWPPKHLILYDYKTRNSRNFDFSKTLSYYHKMQLGTYMYMLRKMEKLDQYWSDGTTLGRSDVVKDLTEARILNIEKDTLRMSESQLIWGPELEKEIVEYWTTINEFWASKKLPKCTCADHENGFLAKEKWNPYFYEGKPCSIEYYNEWKAKQLEAVK